MAHCPCSMSHCGHRRGTTGCKLYAFPREEPWRSQWVKACKRFIMNLDGTKEEWVPGTSARMCSCHFSVQPLRGRFPQYENLPDINLPLVAAKKYRGGGTKRRSGATPHGSESDNEDGFDDSDNGSAASSFAKRSRSKKTSENVEQNAFTDLLAAYDLGDIDGDEMNQPLAIGTTTAEHTAEGPNKKVTKKNQTTTQATTKHVPKTTARKSTKQVAKPEISSEQYDPEFLSDLQPDESFTVATPPASLGLSVISHKCFVCKYEFALECSLRNHLGRRTMKITFTCGVCSDVLTFMNRCAFLTHVLIHNPDEDMEIVSKKAIVKPLRSQYGFADLDVSLKPYESQMSTLNLVTKSESDVAAETQSENTLKTVSDRLEQEPISDITASSRVLAQTEAVAVPQTTVSERQTKTTLTPHSTCCPEDSVPTVKLVEVLGGGVSKNKTKVLIVPLAKSSPPVSAQIAESASILKNLVLNTHKAVSVALSTPKESKPAAEHTPKLTSGTREDEPGTELIKPDNKDSGLPSMKRRRSNDLKPLTKVNQAVVNKKISIDNDSSKEIKSESDLIVGQKIETIKTVEASGNDDSNRVPLSDNSEIDKTSKSVETTKDATDGKRKFTNPTDCPECKVEFINYAAMTVHFSMYKRPNFALKCPDCSMILPTPCSLKSHKRTHTGEEPHICPVCALEVNKAVFQKHMKDKCLVDTRRLVLKCPQCSVTVNGLGLFHEHLLSTHSHMLYKCTFCPMAFNTEQNLLLHSAKSHPMSDFSKGVGEAIHKCPMCTALYKTKKDLTNHMDSQHIRSMACARIFRFVCAYCDTVICESKNELQRHYRLYHGEKFLPNLCNECGVNIGTGHPQGLLGHMMEAHGYCVKHDASLRKIAPKPIPSSATDSPTETETDSEKPRESSKKRIVPLDTRSCPICQHLAEDNASVYQHRRQHTITDSKFWCLVCREIFPSKQALTQHERICTRATDRNGKLLAHMCDFCNDTFLLLTELTSHVNKRHAKPDQFPCPLCGLTYKTAAELSEHTASSHSRQKRKSNLTCRVCEKRKVCKTFTTLSGLKKHIYVVHRNQGLPQEKEKPEIEEPKANTEAPIVKRLKRAGEAVFKCAKCSFSSENKSEFQGHIEQHKEAEGVQCPECGMSFIVEPSLRKHLIMVHKIHEVTKYNKDNGITSPEDEQGKSLRNGFRVDENALDCPVCYKHFTDTPTLKTHLRSHGMAFINMKRASASTSRSGLKAE